MAEVASASLHGVFIEVILDPSTSNDAELAAKLEEVCPVDIFSTVDGRATVVQENVDECVLCGLCLEAAPGAVTIRKIYDDSTL